jgi:hypothetical protein
MRIFLLLAGLVIVLGQPGHAETVEEATDRYFEVMRSGNYVAAANLFDPVELKNFRDSLDFLAQIPESSKDEIYTAFFGVGSTQESVAKLSDQEFFASFFGFAMSQGGMDELMKIATTEYIGHVMEGDIAHAVTRLSAELPGAKFKTMSVASFVSRDGTWKMKMSGEINGVAADLRDAFGL